MSMPTEPIPGATPKPAAEQPAQQTGVAQARSEFFKQSPIGQPGSADRTAAILGMPQPKPEVTLGPAPILTTEPQQDSSNQQPTVNMQDMAAATMLTGMSGDNLTTPQSVPYVQPETPQPDQVTLPQSDPAPAPKKPFWKIW